MAPPERPARSAGERVGDEALRARDRRRARRGPRRARRRSPRTASSPCRGRCAWRRDRRRAYRGALGGHDDVGRACGRRPPSQQVAALHDHAGRAPSRAAPPRRRPSPRSLASASTSTPRRSGRLAEVRGDDLGVGEQLVAVGLDAAVLHEQVPRRRDEDGVDDEVGEPPLGREPRDRAHGGRPREHPGLDRRDVEVATSRPRTWARTISGSTASTAVTSIVLWAVTALTATAPWTPRAANVRRSAWRPAPPLESEPAIVSTTRGVTARPYRAGPRGAARYAASGCRTTSSSTASSCRAASCWGPARWPRCTCCARRSSRRGPRSRPSRCAASTRRRTARCTRCSDELGDPRAAEHRGVPHRRGGRRARAARARGVRHDVGEARGDRRRPHAAARRDRDGPGRGDARRRGVLRLGLRAGRPRRVPPARPGGLRGGHAARLADRLGPRDPQPPRDRHDRRDASRSPSCSTRASGPRRTPRSRWSSAATGCCAPRGSTAPSTPRRWPRPCASPSRRGGSPRRAGRIPLRSWAEASSPALGLPELANP